MVCTVGDAVQAFGAYMMVILPKLLRMPKAGIKARIFKMVTVLLPHVQVIISMGICGAKCRNPIGQGSFMSAAYCYGRACIRDQKSRYFEHEILIGRRGWATHPGANGITRYAGSAHIYKAVGVLHLLHICFYAIIAGCSGCIKYP